MEVGKRIAIVGAGFSGISVAAMLGQLTEDPLHIILFDKSGCFGAGEAYKTVYPWHILNVRARDMSAYENQPNHFVDWVSARQQSYPEIDTAQPISEQFLPRYIYHHYLKDLLQQLHANSKIQLTMQATEIIDAEQVDDHVNILAHDGSKYKVDKVILALGNGSPMQFPFSVIGTEIIANSWDYSALEKIPSRTDVMIVGMGLSMIDTVLTLHQRQHTGKIYAVSRHGLLPLAHTDNTLSHDNVIDYQDMSVRKLMRDLRKCSDWRSAITSLRNDIPMLWEKASLVEKKRFLRHVVPYWNVHRHRVHNKLVDILSNLMQQKQLQTMAGRILKVENGDAILRLRRTQEIKQFKVDWLVNCMGPSMDARKSDSQLLQALVRRGSVVFDPLALGLAATSIGNIYDAKGQFSKTFFTLGPPAKGAVWECTAVPEIRRQSQAMAKVILGYDNTNH